MRVALPDQLWTGVRGHGYLDGVRRGSRMRGAVVVIAVLALTVPAVAGASRIATGRLRAAIEKAAAKEMATGIPQSCLVVRVTTIGAGNWAAVGLNYRKAACNVGNGIVLVHRMRGKWHFVGAGSSMPRTACKRDGIPVAVQRDLRIPCY